MEDCLNLHWSNVGLQLGHWRVGLSFQSTRQINQSLSAWLPFQSRLSPLALRLSLLYRLVLLFKNSCFLCNLSLRLTDLCVVNKLIQEILNFAVFNFKKIFTCVYIIFCIMIQSQIRWWGVRICNIWWHRSIILKIVGMVMTVDGRAEWPAVDLRCPGTWTHRPVRAAARLAIWWRLPRLSLDCLCATLKCAGAATEKSSGQRKTFTFS